MKDVLLFLAKELNSSFFTLLVILITFFVFIYKLAKHIGSAEAERKHTHNKIEKLENSYDTIIEIKTKVDLLYRNLNPNSPVKNASPLFLTDIGERISNSIKAQSTFHRIVASLENKFSSTKDSFDMNAYDIQQWALEVAKVEIPKMLNEKELVLIKDIAYKNGILVEDVMMIFGILLRNHILEKNGVSVSDVDVHDPIQ